MKSYRIFSALLAAALLLTLAAPVRAAGTLHPSYLTGFPDGTIRPDAPVTRAQLAVILARLAEPVPESAEADLPDVPSGHWAHAAAALACETELMNPAPDGLFHPDEPVTGPELAWTLARLSRNEAAAAVWPSLKAGWEAQELSFAAGNGWIMGLDSGTFAPDTPLSRARLAQILNRLLGRTPESLDSLQIGMPLFSDNLDTEVWYFLPLQEAAVTHTAASGAGGEVWTGLG